MVHIRLSDRILNNGGQVFVRRNKPAWLRAKLPGGAGYQRLREIIDRHRLHTVCESARCPNMGECWGQGTATIMILGDICTRSCGFCNVATGRPGEPDRDEPRRVGEAVALMGLDHVVITSVNRDELPDGGAGIWAETIRQVRARSPGTSIEVLIPDFCGNWRALQVVLDAQPDVLGHNLETVRRLYPAVRPQARYERSMELLRRAKEQGFVVKTGIMVGIGERDEEVVGLMEELVERTRTERGCCDILTIGQYLQPTPRHLPVARFVPPEKFEEFKRLGESLGLRHVEAGPLVRSSYHAGQTVQQLGEGL